MFIQPPSRIITNTQIRTNTYETDSDYIDCLGYCLAQYTSRNINDDIKRAKFADGKNAAVDASIPYMLRATAGSPYKGLTCLDIDGTGGHPMSDHASAVIPASNGAFWLVHPYQYETLDEDKASREEKQKFARLAVEYIMPDKTSKSGYTKVAGTLTGFYEMIESGDHPTTPDETDDKLANKHLIGGHPCGAAYLNLVSPIEWGRDTPAVLKATFPEGANTTEELDRYLKMFGNPNIRRGDNKAYADVLVCYGGYHWLRADPDDSNNKSLYFARDGSVRFYAATPRISIYSERPKDVVVDTQLIVWQSILPGGADLPYTSRNQQYAPSAGVGASLHPIGDDGNMFIAVGGVRIKGKKDAYQITRPLVKDDPQRWHEYTIQLIASHQKFVISEEDDKSVTIIHLCVYAENVASSSEYGNYYQENYNCFNPMSELTLPDEETHNNLHINDAAMMYPILYAIDGCLIAHGAEWIGDRPHDGEGITTSTLSDLVKKTYKPEGGTAGSHVFHIPLVTTQYLLRGRKGHHIYPYPLNISGALGMMEGAFGVPSKDGKSLIIVGGCVSEYGEHCYSPNDLKPFNEVVCQLAPPYGIGDVHLIPFDSKIITASAAWNKPYSLGIDTLKFDCLFSQCVQLGSGDYFVAPSSYFGYTSGGNLRPNATLIKRVQPMDMNDPKLRGMSPLEAFDALHTRMRVSEVANMSVKMETPKTYAQETPCYYGRASVAKHSIGAVADTTDKNSFWMYRLGNGNEPADYYHIITLQSAKSLWNDVLDAFTVSLDETNTPGYPLEDGE